MKLAKQIRFKPFSAICTLFCLVFLPISNAFAHSNYGAYEYQKCSPFEKYKQFACSWGANAVNDVASDFSIFYGIDNLIVLGDIMVAAGILANTNLDRSIRDAYQQGVRSSGTDNFFRIPEQFGGGAHLLVPLYAVTMMAGFATENTRFGNVIYHWGYRSLRTVLLGGIPACFLGRALGGGRPINNQDSKWQPFKFRTGVSGHAFFGAIPFISAAEMTDSPAARFALLALSTLPGLSRINSDNHYTSQVLLGWSFAFLAGRAVYETDATKPYTYHFAILPRDDGLMLTAHMRF